MDTSFSATVKNAQGSLQNLENNLDQCETLVCAMLAESRSFFRCQSKQSMWELEHCQQLIWDASELLIEEGEVAEGTLRALEELRRSFQEAYIFLGRKKQVSLGAKLATRLHTMVSQFTDYTVFTLLLVWTLLQKPTIWCCPRIACGLILLKVATDFVSPWAVQTMEEVWISLRSDYVVVVVGLCIDGGESKDVEVIEYKVFGPSKMSQLVEMMWDLACAVALM